LNIVNAGYRETREVSGVESLLEAAMTTSVECIDRSVVL
jgi:hypothetical protein